MMNVLVWPELWFVNFSPLAFTAVCVRIEFHPYDWLMHMLIASDKNFNKFSQLNDVFRFMLLYLDHGLVQAVIWVAPMSAINLVNSHAQILI